MPVERSWWERPEVKVRSLVFVEKMKALHKHGRLQGGMGRWIHHLREECEEAVEEMHNMEVYRDMPGSRVETETRKRLIEELAQVVQLAEGMMAMLLLNREWEGEETWGKQG